MEGEFDALMWARQMAVPNRFGTPEYSPFVCHVMNTLDSRAHGPCECQWVSPYGWVPEAGCREHDPDE